LLEAKSRWMPDLISRFGSHADDASGGVGLVAGVVEGRAWVLDEPSTRPPADMSGDPIVLVAPSVDAGWLPTFSLVDAAAVELGGDLSHGSIILREVGLPAVTNVGGLRQRVQTGDWLRVDGNTGTAELLPT
jgi:pyruvate,water dikinase